MPIGILISLVLPDVRIDALRLQTGLQANPSPDYKLDCKQTLLQTANWIASKPFSSLMLHSRRTGIYHCDEDRIITISLHQQKRGQTTGPRHWTSHWDQDASIGTRVDRLMRHPPHWANPISSILCGSCRQNGAASITNDLNIGLIWWATVETLGAPFSLK